jgi:O-antigen/teichoic acid export membrane protein
VSRSDVESTLTLVQRGGTLLCAALALWAWPDVTVLAAAMLVPAAATLAYSAQLAGGMAAAFSEGAGRADRDVSGMPSVWTEIARDVAPIGAGILLSALYFRLDLFLLQAWRGAEAVALYNAVFRLVEALRLFPAALLAVMLPALVRAADGRPLVQVSAAVTGFGALVALAVWLSAAWLVPLVYGPGYAAAVPAFRILALSFPLMSLNYALTHQLVGWSGHRAYAAVCLAALVFNIALNARLIPSLSIDGAAWATLWTEGLVTVGCAIALAPGLAARGAAGARTAPAVVEPQ